MSAGKYDFTIEQGATLSIPIAYKDSSEVLQDLSSYTIRMKIKSSPGGTVYASTEGDAGSQTISEKHLAKAVTLSHTTGIEATDFVSSGGTDSATIKITDYQNISAGTTITMANNLGVEKAFAYGGAGTSGTDHDTWMSNESNDTTADNIYTMLNQTGNEAWTVANPSANEVTVTRSSFTPVDNNIELSMTATATAALDFDTGVYDLELVSGTEVTRLLEGIVTLSREVSA